MNGNYSSFILHPSYFGIMPELTQSVVTLINEFAKLPGIGRKSAERLTYHVLRVHKNEALALAEAIRSVKENVRYCSKCFNLAEEEQCDICKDSRRERDVLCVVEQPRDLIALEQAGVYRGLYHVLLGRIAPLENIHPDQLTLDALVERVRSGRVQGSHPGHQPDGGRRRHLAAHIEPARANFRCKSPASPAASPPAACWNSPTRKYWRTR